MKWLFIIDHIEKLKLETDTTYAIMRESSKRTETFISTVQDLFFDSKVKTACKQIFFEKNSHKFSDADIYELDEFDLVFMRKEPPYNLNFHYAAQLLSLAKTKVVNSPKALRDFNEKLIILNFPKMIPKTIVSSDVEEVMAFIESQNYMAVLKSLDSYQGKSIEIILARNSLKEKIIKITNHGKIPIMAQEFLPSIKKGDKRILVLGGRIIGAVNRIPKKNSYLSNFAQGGIGIKAKITPKEEQIARELAPFFIKNGIHFAGLDVIGGKLTEINITCPTGLQQINRLEKKNLEKEVVEYFLNI